MARPSTRWKSSPEQLGLAAQQILVPLDHVLLNEAAALPAIAVVRSATGGAHFVVVWRRHGPLVQVMDPARGRLWMTRQAFLDQMVVHSMTVSRSGLARVGRIRRVPAAAPTTPARHWPVDDGIATAQIAARSPIPAGVRLRRSMPATRMIASLQSAGAL